MSMIHRHPADKYAAQLEAIGAGESRVIILETGGGAIQKGDVLDFGPKATELAFKPAQTFTVFRAIAGTKANGILPGFVMIEVTAPPSQMIAGPQPDLPGADG